MSTIIETYKQDLGPDAKFGIFVQILDENGRFLKEEGYNSKQAMPMASTAKIGIALAILEKVFNQNEITLQSNITISDEDFCPGNPTNTLDRYFFNPLNSEQNVTVEKLLYLMLTESDNTATDKLLQIVGGTEHVNQLLHSLDIADYHLKRTIKQLLTEYYEIPNTKSIYNIAKVSKELLFVYKLRETETYMFSNYSDTCTPHSMNNLLKLLIVSSFKNDSNWLTKASKIICDIMQHCITGENLIKKATKEFSGLVKQFGSKTGGLGGIRCDAGYIKIENIIVILSIFTSHSPNNIEQRERFIANLSFKILQEIIGNLENLEYAHIIPTN